MAITKWDMSDWIAKDDEPLTEGEHTLQIENAVLDDATKAYTLTLRCVETDQVSTVKYFPVKKDGSKNKYAIGSLNSLGRALFGFEVGIPFMNDVLDGIVKANVQLGGEYAKSDGTKGHYINIYSYSPIDKETYDVLKESGFKIIEDQYWIGKPINIPNGGNGGAE